MVTLSEWNHVHAKTNLLCHCFVIAVINVCETKLLLSTVYKYFYAVIWWLYTFLGQNQSIIMDRAYRLVFSDILVQLTYANVSSSLL